MRLYELIKLTEAPIQDYDTVGDFSKNSSFRKERDRHLITNPATIERVKQKFANNAHPFNLLFVNGPKANKHTEVGKVTLKWVADNLGQEVADKVANGTDMDSSINVIFTNNKGTQGKNMTAWIMAHRIAHALARSEYQFNKMAKQFQNYEGSANVLHSYASDLMKEYGKQNAPTTYNAMAKRDGGYGTNGRGNQLSFLHLMTKLCTFRSARENVVRDWFEILHELFAQYITTGKITFNPAPRSFGSTQNGKYYLRGDESSANEIIGLMASGIEEMFNELLHEAEGTILVM